MMMKKKSWAIPGSIFAWLWLGIGVDRPAQAQDACAPACAPGQLCVQGVCMIPAPPPSSTGPAPADGPGPAQATTGPGGYPPQSYPPSPPYSPTQPYPPPPPGYSAGTLYPPQGYGAPPPGYQGYPPPAVVPMVSSLPPRRRGFLALPFIGAHTFVGSTGQDLGVGFRLGTLLGGRISDDLSLNGELIIDVLNRTNLPSGTDSSAADVVLAFSPLYHLHKRSVEVVVGPKLGFHGQSGQTDYQGQTNKFRGSGVVLGGNLGVLGALSDSVSLGGLVSFDARFYSEICTTDPGYSESCTTDQMPDADKVFGFTGALLF